MSTTNVEDLAQNTKTGDIVLFRGLCNLQDSFHAVVPPMDFWTDKASKRAHKTFIEYSESCPQIPIMVFGDGNEWYPAFTEESNAMLMWSLYDDDEVFGRSSRIYSCCTLRDGSRYYKEFLNDVLFIKSFLLQEKKLIDNKHLVKNFFDLIKSLLEWKNIPV